MPNSEDRFIEDVGLLFESDGMSRISGRVFTLLLLSPVELSMEEIAERLSVSRGSVSTDTRQLEQCGFLERVARRGDRKVYYRIRRNYLEYALERRIEMQRRLIEVMERGEQIPDLAPDVLARISESVKANRDILELMTEYVNRCKEKPQ